MVEVIIVVREPGSGAPDYSLTFELPEVPAIGSYISINRPDLRDPLGEDLIVRHVWWRLFHPATGSGDPAEAESRGRTVEIFIECDPAIGPYASQRWRQSHEGRPEVENFNVARRRIYGPEDE